MSSVSADGTASERSRLLSRRPRAHSWDTVPTSSESIEYTDDGEEDAGGGRFGMLSRRRSVNRRVLRAMIRAEHTVWVPANKRFLLPYEDDDFGDDGPRGPQPTLARSVDEQARRGSELLRGATLISYSGDKIMRQEIGSIPRLAKALDSKEMEKEMPENSAPVTRWLYASEHSDALLDFLRDQGGVHPAVIEDSRSQVQRPKADFIDGNLVLITHCPEMRRIDGTDDTFQFEQNQIVMFVLPAFNLVITMQQDSYFCTRYNPTLPSSQSHTHWASRVSRRIEENVDLLRGKGVSHLVYAVLDSIVDRYFPLLEFYGEHLEELETLMIEELDPQILRGVTRIKREMLLIRRLVWPMRDCFGKLQLLPDNFLDLEAKLYMRGLHDHMLQIVDILETYRDISMGLFDLYMGSMNNRQNEIVKILTIISTIFIPLTFITGVFGMNFDNMPELSAEHGYAYFWVAVILIIIVQFLIFFYQKWI
ncbi:Cobalt/magnesium transport protein CorA [Porphyridium purpureum]|uniref:Cobalt/magnesium transport protein CorA n=1 Tax=Porphyridium purpureum TaxID=35688 RepID=A0A5J4Z2X1_PORPP|nr:Cobalt/magnesium transport protein CorA [Porphyridium purpureum]|eukprot:POR0716..scf208_2